MTLKEFVLANVKPEDFYEARFTGWDRRVRSNVACPFHDDGSNPNLAIALKNGGARCHSSQCAKRIGNIVHFEAERLQIKEPMAARKIYREFIRKIVPSKQLAEYRENLSNNTQYILKIKKEMGLTFASIKRFQLGLDTTNHRITIPIYDRFGQCVNVRFYRLPSERSANDSAKLYNLKGYGGNDLFPWSQAILYPKSSPLFVMASEKEAMLAIQDGLPAISSTSGEDKWSPEWSEVSKGRQVFTVFDTDKGGDGARKRVAPLVQDSASSVVHIVLPFGTKRKDRKDYADWRLREKHPVQDFLKVVGKHKVKEKKNASISNADAGGSDTDVHPRVRNKPEEKEVEYPDLPDFVSDDMYDIAAISSRAELLNKRIRTQGIVAAKSPNTYSIPWKFTVNLRGRPAFEYSLPMGRELLRFVRASDTQILQSLQNLVGSGAAEIEPVAYLTVTEIEVIPTAVIDQDVPYVVQRCYYFGQRIEANVPYYLEIIPTSEIRSQETIGIITGIKTLAKSIDRFDFTPENLADLSFFQPTQGESVFSKLSSLANEVAVRHTRVYNRLDWTISALLTWTSPIGWRFPSEPDLQRGWLNTLAIGDTETGKSKVALGLRKLFNCGSFVNGENCTFVGLVGGAIKMGSGQLMLRWGRIPLSDKQLVVLEELSGLSVEEISNMSDVRSSGIARLDKGGINSETNSRTRLLCLSNSRNSKKSLSNYLFGVHAIQELIGHGEDIARFDLITTLTDREVSVNVINSKFATIANEFIAEDQFKKLIHFIWALTPEQIEFGKKAYEECLEQTKRLSGIYHPSIPIFKGGSGRYKLGRIAASIACLQFAWDTSKEKVVVTSGHVGAAAELLETIYAKRSFGYHEYSIQMWDRDRVKDTTIVRKSFNAKVSKSTLPKVLETLIHATRFNRDELNAVAGTTFTQSDQLIGTMFRERVIRKGEGNMWELTPAGKEFFEDYIKKLRKKA